MSGEEIRTLINDDPENNAKVRRYGAGSTALVVLQVGRDIWTANVGDCKATIGYKIDDEQWKTEIISGGPHNGGMNAEEKEKVIRDHAGEDNVMEKDRVLGLIAVTRGESRWTSMYVLVRHGMVLIRVKL